MNGRNVQIVAVIVMVIGIAGAAILSPSIHQQRRSLNLTYDTKHADRGRVTNVFYSAALGSFRGILANVLWYHAEKQKQAGRLFDANDTAQLITEIMPQFPHVWAYNAWNMAYNISVITQTPTERWDWVQKGVDLLRSRGIPANPKAIRLYRELSWIFSHKIGGWSDDMHWFYKRAVANEWQQLLGPPPEGRRSDHATAAFAPIAEAAEKYLLFDRPPRDIRNTLSKMAEDVQDDRLLNERLLDLKWADADTLERGLGRLVKRTAETRPRLSQELEQLHQQSVERLARATKDPLTRLREDAPNVVPILGKIEGWGMKLDRASLMKVGVVITQLRLIPQDQVIAQRASMFSPDTRELALSLLEPEHIEGWRTVLSFWRAKVITDDPYHMDPAFMYELMENYGPMDWRHPAAHSAYWAAMGVDRSELLRNKEDVDFINTQRQVVHSMQFLMHTGRVVLEPYSNNMELLPDPRFIEGYERAREEGRAISEIYRNLGPEDEDHFVDGHQNLLADAIVISYLYGSDEQAQGYLDRVRKLYGHRQENIGTGRFNKPLHEFVMSEMFTGELPMRAAALALIEGALNRAFTEGLAYGRFDTFQRAATIAERAHNEFQAERGLVLNANAEQQRLALPPFPEMVEKAFVTYLQSEAIDMLLRSRAYYNSPMALREAVYEKARPSLVVQAQARGIDVDRAFPPPPGFDPAASIAAQESPDGNPEPTIDDPQNTVERN